MDNVTPEATGSYSRPKGHSASGGGWFAPQGRCVRLWNWSHVLMRDLWHTPDTASQFSRQRVFTVTLAFTLAAVLVCTGK